VTYVLSAKVHTDWAGYLIYLKGCLVLCVVNWTEPKGFTESQNSWGWKGCLKII